MIILGVVLSACAASAHQVYLTDGTVATGTVKSYGADGVTVENTAGEIVIPREKIERIEYIDKIEYASDAGGKDVIYFLNGSLVRCTILKFDTDTIWVRTVAGETSFRKDIIARIAKEEETAAQPAPVEPAKEIIPETSPIYPMLDRWGIGLFYPGITFKYWTESPWAIEIRGAAGPGIGVAGFRFYYNLPLHQAFFLLFGGEVDVSFFSVDDIDGWGLAFEGFAGVEYRLTKSISFTADIGPAWVMAFDPPGGYAGGLDFILNVGFNYYFPKGKKKRRN